MRGRIPAAVCTVLVLFLCGPAGASSTEPAGIVKTTQGEASILRDGAVITPEPGTRVFPGDRLSTGGDGTLGVIFRDDSVLSLGHDSSIDLDSFVFSPARGKLGIAVRIARGTISYLSGLIGKLSPESVKFETPEASIGIRGTHFAVLVEPER